MLYKLNFPSNMMGKKNYECTKSRQKKNIKQNIHRLLHISEAKVLKFINNPHLLDALFLLHTSGAFALWRLWLLIVKVNMNPFKMTHHMALQSTGTCAFNIVACTYIRT